MPLTRAALKCMLHGVTPADFASQSPSNPLPSDPPLSGIRARITSEIKTKLSRFWDPETLEWVIDNETLTMGELLDMGIDLPQTLSEDDIDWAELEQNSSDEDDVRHPGPRDVYGVPLNTCGICQKLDVGTRLPSCWHCGKKAHVSCLHWIAREDPRKPGHFQFQCPLHSRVKFLEGRRTSDPPQSHPSF